MRRGIVDVGLGTVSENCCSSCEGGGCWDLGCETSDEQWIACSLYLHVC